MSSIRNDIYSLSTIYTRTVCGGVHDFWFIAALANVFLCQSHLFWLTNATFYLTQPENVPTATLEECALLGLFLETGKLLFSWPGGMLLDKYGSKKVTLIIGFINSLSWMMLVFCNSLNWVYIVRWVSNWRFNISFASVQVSKIIFPKCDRQYVVRAN